MNLRNNLNLCIEALEAGRQINLKSGHKLLWSDEHEGPGFHAIQEPSYGSPDGLPQEMIFQINSDTAWMCLIDYARKMTDNDATILAANMALTEINQKKRG